MLKRKPGGNPRHRALRPRAVLALVPLALVSGLWSASLVSAGVNSASSDERTGSSLPDGTAVPTRAIETGANHSARGSLGLGVQPGASARIVRTASTNGIPAAAIAAYQRADTVINASDAACELPWELVAAIGRVESDHGRYAGNTLDARGVARPGIYGIPLDGSNNTRAITDTDAGQFDNDKVWDRAVGPMQFIPSTWSVVGVDADGDAQRNPQDIDDAALAAAVYLCSGADDLSTDLGRRKAVHRYNHSGQYVDLVLSVMAAYTEGDYYSAPNMATSAVTFVRDRDQVAPTKIKTRNHGTTGQAASAGASTTTATTSTSTSAAPTTNDPPKVVTGTVQHVTTTLTTTVQQVLSLPQAILQCTLRGLNPLTTPAPWKACIAELT